MFSWWDIFTKIICYTLLRCRLTYGPSKTTNESLTPIGITHDRNKKLDYEFMIWNPFRIYQVTNNKVDTLTYLCYSWFYSLLDQKTHCWTNKASNPSQHFLFQIQKCKHQKNMWHLLKFSKKDTITMSVMSYWYLCYQLWANFTHCSGVSIVKF